MKKLYLSLMLMTAVPLMSAAQTFIQVGTATTSTSSTGPSLMGTYYHDNLNQLIFTAAELSAAGIGPGLINGIAFNVTSVGSPALTTWNISMGHTTMSQFGSFWVPQNTLTPVYSANNYQPTSGWNTYTFTTPFIWNGVDNLVIQTCFDNSSYISNYGMEYTATSFPSNRWIYADGMTNPCDTMTWASSWNTPTNTTERMNTRFYWIPNVNDDAGIAAVDSPAMPGCTFGNALYVTLSNMGADTLNNVTINWSVNGITQTPSIWSGALNPVSTLPGVFVGNYGFSANDAILVWTTNPNGVSDAYSANDSMMLNLIPALNGVYNIGGPNADYYSFSAAALDLESRGVCGPVTFMVNDSTYTEQVTINSIPGSSATNNITFMSTSGDSTLAILTSSTSGSTNPATLMLKGGSYITFKNLTIRNTSTFSYNYAIDVRNGSTNNKFINNVIENPTTTSTSTIYSVIYGTGANHDHEFSGNVINGGSTSIYWYGPSSSASVNGFVVENNEISNSYYYGVYTYYANSPIISGNKIMSTNSYLYGWYGVYLAYSSGGFEVTGNKVLNPKTTGYGYPVYVYYSNGSANDRGLISNNFLMVGDSASSTYGYGIYTYYSTNLDIISNNVNILGTSGNGRGAYLYYGGGLNVYNNNFVSQGGYGLYNASSFIINQENNNYYSPNGTMAYMNGTYNTISAWQTGTGFDMNGYNVNPNYYDSADLHICNDTLDGAGKALGMMTDIDGDMRSMTAPDIGADEFISSRPDIGADTTVCENAPFVVSLAGASNASFLWSTGDTTSSITVTTPALYWVDVTTACGMGSDTIDISHKPLPTPNFTYTNSYLTGIFTNTSNAGTTYMWDFGDGTTSTEANPLHIFQNSGFHNVTLYVTNECGTDSITVPVNIQVVGVDENALNGGLSVYPNPSAGNFTMNLSGMDGQIVNMTIIDLEGRVIAAQEITVGSDNFNQQFDFSKELGRGMYFVKVQNENGSGAVRIVVQ